MFLASDESEDSWEFETVKELVYKFLYFSFNSDTKTVLELTPGFYTPGIMAFWVENVMWMALLWSMSKEYRTVISLVLFVQGCVCVWVCVCIFPNSSPCFCMSQRSYHPLRDSQQREHSGADEQCSLAPSRQKGVWRTYCISNE